MAAQVYSASLMAIEVDTDAERSYLDGLARAMPAVPKEDMCLACFNNDYPTAVPANEEGEKYALEGNC